MVGLILVYLVAVVQNPFVLQVIGCDGLYCTPILTYITSLATYTHTGHYVQHICGNGYSGIMRKTSKPIMRISTKILYWSKSWLIGDIHIPWRCVLRYVSHVSRQVVVCVLETGQPNHDMTLCAVPNT